MLNWYYQSGKESDVVMSTRIKISRNIAGIPFVARFNNLQARSILNKLEQAITPANYGLKMFNLKNIDDLTRKSLAEKHIVTPKYINSDIENKAILINDDENICIMLNEKEHLEIQVLASGLELENSLSLAMEIEDKLDRELKFSYNEKYGYLTSSPTNLGTGLRASAIVHLPGLTKTQNISKMLEAVNNLGMNIRSVYNDENRAKSNMYQISNKQTLGISEKDIVKNLKAILDKIIEQERLARKILTKNEIELEDKLYRSYGIMANARKISSDEMTKLISDVRLGVDMGIINEMTDLKVNKLEILSKPANLQKYFGENLDIFDRDIKRAELVKKILSE